MTSRYHLIATSDNRIPHDVLVEHLAVAMRDLNYAGRTDIRMVSAAEAGTRRHPFEGPEVFDDVQAEEYDGPRPGVDEPGHASGGYVEGVSNVDIEVTLPADPYPTITRALDALKGLRRGRAVS